MTTSILTPAPWMYEDGSGIDKGDIFKDPAEGGWVKIYPDGHKELLLALKVPGNIGPFIASVANMANGTYSCPESLTFTVTFSENVTVTGFPKLAVFTTDSSVPVMIPYVSGTGGTVLTFTGNTNILANGNLNLLPEVFQETGSIVDSLGNSCNDNFADNYVQPAAIVMFTARPTSITNPVNGSVSAAAAMTFLVTFNGPVTIGGTGTPKLRVSTGGPNIDLPVTGGGGTATLTFSAVLTGIGAGALVVSTTLLLATSTLSDANANPAYLVFPAGYVPPVITVT